MLIVSWNGSFSASRFPLPTSQVHVLLNINKYWVQMAIRYILLFKVVLLSHQYDDRFELCHSPLGRHCHYLCVFMSQLTYSITLLICFRIVTILFPVLANLIHCMSLLMLVVSFNLSSWNFLLVFYHLLHSRKMKIFSKHIVLFAFFYIIFFFIFCVLVLMRKIKDIPCSSVIITPNNRIR